MINLVGELLDLSVRAEAAYIAAWWVMAAIVIAVCRPGTQVPMESGLSRATPPGAKAMD
jgi:hypothetical protein